MSRYKKKEIIRRPFSPKYPPSKEQSVIFGDIKIGDGNIQVQAVAGSGKSTTLKWICAMTNERNGGLMAFNSDIVQEILPETPDYIDVKTCHAMGYGPLIKAFGSRVKDKGTPKTIIILEGIPAFNRSRNETEKTKMFRLRGEIASLVSKIKVTLTDWNDVDKVNDLIGRFNIDIDGYEDEVMDSIDFIMRKSIEEVKMIDFDDMMWLPIMHDLKLHKYDLLLIDEAQDLNKLMQEYAKRISCGRLVIVGDPRQAIYGFSGADSNSYYNLKEMFNTEEYPLSVCYRCGTDIIAEAQKINPNIQAYEGNGRGEVRHINNTDFNYDETPDGALILSRKNATLVKPCFEFIKRGRKAIIKGREIGKGLIGIIENLGDCNVIEFESKIEDWRDQKICALSKRKNPTQSSLDYVNDQADALIAISDGCRDTSDMKNKINEIFQEKGYGGIVCSSIHKSKGLEAEHVSIMDYGNVELFHQKMKPEDLEQEKNLHYVALTRAKKTLELVSYTNES